MNFSLTAVFSHQEKRRTCDVILRGFHEVTVCIEKRLVLHTSVCGGGGMSKGALARGVCLRACSLTYLACHSQTPYCLGHVSFHHIFRHYLTGGTIFEKKVIEHKMCILILSTTLFKTFLILRRIQRDLGTNVKTS